MHNVGQGDAFVCQLATGEVIVIDCKRSDSGIATLNTLEEIRSERGSADIDVLCLTHPHYDHFSGMSEIFRWCKDKGGKIKKLVVYHGLDRKRMANLLKKIGFDSLESPLEEFVLLDREIRRFKKFEKPHNFVLGVGRQSLLESVDSEGNSYSVEVIGPLGAAVENNLDRGMLRLLKEMQIGVVGDDGELNDLSCILLIRCNDCTMLFTGDSSARLVWQSWNGDVRRGDVTEKVGIIKMPHHGSRGENRSWPTTLQTWKQICGANTVALLSFGANNTYRHPHVDLLNLLQDLNVATLSTNPCSKCSTGHGGEFLPSSTRDITSSEIVIEAPSCEYVELRIEGDGKITPVKMDSHRRCSSCNNFPLPYGTSLAE